MQRILIYFLFASLVSCSGGRYLSNQNIQEIYRAGANTINPEFEVFHVNKDSSRLYFKINVDELLYKDPEGQGNLKARFALYCTIYTSYDSKIVLDTITTFFEHESVDFDGKYVLQFIDLEISSGRNYVLKVETRDLNKGEYYFDFIEIDKKNTESRQFYKICKPGTDYPIFKTTLNKGEKFVIIPSNPKLKGLTVRYFKRNYPLAAPPFVVKRPDKFEFDPDREYYLDIGPESALDLGDQGLYYFYFKDTLVKERLTLFRFATDYPSITAPDQLIEPLRYLTTNEEYVYLKSRTDPKKAVDNYWLDIAGSEERGKQLIKSYYTRVQFANFYFSSYLEGWKSDRGLIYIIFGVPDRVFKTGREEYWSYESAPYRNAINFSFERLNNPFTTNDYVLQRSQVYEYPWYTTVEAWRQGRVATEIF
ncbi:MAG: GWxTD domain-containing protein [Bacteroidia bacterium]|nr:GWxTD domain-containing protein [Bacteroidia bacterium]